MWLFIGLSHYFTQVRPEPPAVVPVHRGYDHTYGQTGDVEQHHEGPIDQEPHVLVCVFLLCKFFDSEVHPGQATFDDCYVSPQHTLAPCTYDSTHGAERKQHKGQYDDCLDESHHMISVPCNRPSIKPMAIALKNMPVMIHTRSISTSPCSRSSRPSVSGTEVPVLSVWPARCSWPSRSSQHP